MKIKNIIFGKRSILTKDISKKLDNFEVYSTNDLHLIDFDKINKQKSNYIFNNFYPSSKLNTLNVNKLNDFVELSIGNLVIILSKLNSKNINKIIYSSSSSIYNIKDALKNIEHDNFNREIYSAFKFSAEKIIQNYCNKEKINFYIMRLFNIYGRKNDEFSLIERLIKSKQNNYKITLNNNGLSLRDFINVSDVSNIYLNFIKNKHPSGIYDVGTGRGYLIRNLFDFVGINNNKLIHKKNINELTGSIANIDNLKKCLGEYQFKSLESYFKSKIKVKENKKLYFTSKLINKKNYEGSVIYGAGFAGKELFAKLIDQKENIIFFVDDDPKKNNTIFEGIPVINFENLKQLNHKSIIDKVYIAIPSINKNQINIITKKLNNYFFDVRHLPEKKFLINNQINLNDLEIDQINSFIDREQIKRKKLLNLKNHNILVTGAAGTIGSEICRQLVFHNANKIIGIDQSEIGIYNIKNKLDIKKVQLILDNANDKSVIDKIIKDKNITLIIHAAAYKHVNILEENIYSAITNNVMLTKNLCEVAKKNNINFILISTDKAADPSSILGYTKKISEQLVHYYNLSRVSKKFFNIVRFGNVFGSSGSAITKFINQINKNEAITITNKKATRYFMTILEACYLVLSITSIKIKNKTFVLNMGKPINIYELSKKLSQLKKNVDDNYNFKYIETGLKKNEKLHEVLFNKNEKLSKINKNIFYTSRNKFNNKKFTKLFLDFEKNYKKFSKKKVTKYLKALCKI